MRSICVSLILVSLVLPAAAASTEWTFANPADRLAATGGPAALAYHDPAAEGWGPALTTFGRASALGLPAMPGGDADVMAFPACAAQQGYRLTHGAMPNGAFEPDGRVSNYTIIMDVLFPAASDAQWRSLWQTSPDNTDDADFFVQNAASGGIGINSNYLGRILPDTWHRVVITVRAAPGEGHCQRYIDGLFVGGLGTTGSGLDLRWSLGGEALFFTDNDGETTAGYCAGLAFIDRALFPAEVAALGGPHAAGALVPGNPPPPAEPMVRRVGVIGHRGGAFDRAPDNTLAGIRAGIADGVQGIEVDTRLTADGVCVAFHDATVDRTTDGTGAVADMTLAELKALDAGSWYDPAFAGERVPSLAQVFEVAKGKCIIFLDIKTNGQADAILSAVASTGFPLTDLWFWTTNSASAAEIRAVIPQARLMWGAPDASWSTDPDYFTGLKAQGVIGFSFSAGSGAVDSRFCARAKEEGMIVEIFTILTPDAMRAAAVSGVDYVENDHPAAMNSLQPTQTPAARLPFPADGATGVPPDLVMRWVTGLGATQRRVFFGTSAPGSDLGLRTSDLLARSNLAWGTTYFWRVDEISATGTTPGPVWSFTTLPRPPSANLVGLWLFDRADDPGHATIGQDLAIEGDAPEWLATQADDAGGEASGVITTAAGPASRLRCTHGIGANGGGTFTNRYTIVMDILSPPGSRGSWRSLLQTNSANGNDGDYFIRTDNRVGVGALTYGPTIDSSSWKRLAFTMDLAQPTSASLIRTVLDGGTPFVHSPQPRDGRFALDASVLFFADEDGENAPLHVAMLALFDGSLSLEELAALGATLPEGLYPRPSLEVGRSGSRVTLTWPPTPGYLLQRSPGTAAWTDLPETFGLGEWSEPIVPTPGRMFFRLAPR